MILRCFLERKQELVIEITFIKYGREVPRQELVKPVVAAVVIKGHV
ncbi:MAG: hypothetical protein ACI959_000656 [Limisphaerales bacterium]|jgi:hypothetical protein